MDVKVNLEDDLKVNAHIVFLDFDKFTFRNKLSQCVTLLRQKKLMLNLDAERMLWENPILN
jgi:hypothetical protein